MFVVLIGIVRIVFYSKAFSNYVNTKLTHLLKFCHSDTVEVKTLGSPKPDVGFTLISHIAHSILTVRFHGKYLEK